MLNTTGRAWCTPSKPDNCACRVISARIVCLSFTTFLFQDPDVKTGGFLAPQHLETTAAMISVGGPLPWVIFGYLPFAEALKEFACLLWTLIASRKGAPLNRCSCERVLEDFLMCVVVDLPSVKTW